jgi:hypothetical protein
MSDQYSSEKYKAIENVFLGRDQFENVDDLIREIKAREAETAKNFLPQFATVQEERLHRKKMLVLALRLLAKYKYDEGVAGR